MKLAFLTVSLVTAFTVEPGPDSQHSIIAEQPQWPDFTSGPHNSEETSSITAEKPQGPGFTFGPQNSEEKAPITAEKTQRPGFSLGSHDSEESTMITAEQTQAADFTLGTEQLKETTSIFDEHPWFNLEEEKEQSELELRGSGCKAKLSCSIPGGYCVDNATLCNPGRLVPAGCKGSCQCCIPECPEEQGYIRPPGSHQCFKLFTDRYRNWTDSVAHCKANGMVLAHPYDAVSLRDYMVERLGHPGYPWLNARGTGSYFYWQDNNIRIENYDPLWTTGHPSSKASSYCLLFLVHSWWSNHTATKPFYSYGCRGTLRALCQVVWD